MREPFSCAMRAIRRRFGRVLLTVISIAIGVSSVVLITNVGEIGKSFINNELGSLGLGGITITPASGESRMVSPDVVDIAASLNVTEAAIPIIFEYTSASYRNHVLPVAAWGIDENVLDVITLTPLHGRLISSYDVKKGAKVCLVDENFALLAYKRTNIIGKTISVTLGSTTDEYEVVGVVKTGSSILQSIMTDVVPTFVYLPYTTVQAATAQEGLSQVAVKTVKGVSSEEAAEIILEAVQAGSGDSISYTYQNLALQKDQLNNILNIVSSVLGAIAAISLLVAGLGIMNVMIVSVSERTREIGIKKAIGASENQIIFEFLSESFIVTCIGSIIGCAVSLIITVILCSLMGIVLSINLGLILFCISLAVAIGLVFSFYPSYKAAKLNPIEALRHI